MNEDIRRRIHAAQVDAAEQVVIADLRARGLADPSNGPAPAQIDAGADALRQRQMASRITRPWTDLPNSDKRKWREHAEAVLRAAAQAGE